MIHRRAGITLIEMVVAMFLTTLILGASMTLYVQSSQQSARPGASMRMEADMLNSLRLLERDLSETSQQSIKVFPNKEFPQEPPGVSMESARSLSNDTVVLSEFGGLRWQKYVYYTWDEARAQLYRLEGNLWDQGLPFDVDRRIPQPSGLPPTAARPINGVRTVAANIHDVSIVAGDPVVVTFRIEEPNTRGFNAVSTSFRVHPNN